MKKVQQKDERDIKWEKFMRYLDLLFKYWEIKDTLWREYPDRMSESTKRLVKICLDREYVKCKHEE